MNALKIALVALIALALAAQREAKSQSALQIDSSRNLVFGAPLPSLTGADNIFLGGMSGLNATSATTNVCFGFRTCLYLTTNSGTNEPGANVAIGNLAGKFFGVVGDGGNVAVGEAAGGSYASCPGGAAAGCTGYRNTYVGQNAGAFNSTGTHNTFVGSAAGLVNTTGGSNSFFGRGTGDHNTTGSYNFYAGHAAGFLFTVGDNNVFLGNSAGNAGPATMLGNYNVGIGTFAGPLGSTDDHTIYIGPNTSGAGNNYTAIGHGQVAAYVSGNLGWAVTTSAVSSGSGVTYTVAQFLGGTIVRGAAATDTTPNAADMVAAMPACEPGASRYLDLINPNSGTLTLTAGAGVTLTGTTTISPNYTRRYLVTATNCAAGIEAVTVLGVMTGAM